ncbi:glycosyltransferase [Mucilaginibacter sp. UR6-1]|uniref:glycosyltransferase n=1 Tax=Mucilaginibacter sp. UR6-1 TaxID=1435643 RepID=UPI001E2AEEA9|nr:glycosyltransferase [Mucilaginibacter sp. UR6-1]MCC8408166.1 glycosyltransferase [Mucilaginibacter sp. UR6-1]
MGLNHKKNVLLMGHVDGLGGAQIAYRELIDFVKAEGHNLRIINITDDKNGGRLTDADLVLGRIEHKTPGLVDKVKKYRSLLSAAKQARSFKPDVFVSIGLSNSSNFITRYLSNDCFKIAQDFIANRSKEEEIWNKSRGSFNGIAVQAPSMLDYWKTNLTDASDVNWLPCFPAPPVSGVLRKQESGEKQQIRLAYFGRLAGNKGLPLLFNTLTTLPNRQNVKLDLWGKGEEETNLKKLAAELDLDSIVSFKGGYPADRDGAELMASYDGLVLTSTEMEGLPLVLLESMAYGLPFMATNIGAIRDCCIDNPDTVLVEPDQHSISEGLSKLINNIKTGAFDPVRLKNYYDQHFSHKVMADRWRACLNNPKLFFNEAQ